MDLSIVYVGTFRVAEIKFFRIATKYHVFIKKKTFG